MQYAQYTYSIYISMVLLREAIIGRADVLILGQKKLNPIRKFYYCILRFKFYL
jgi:hypothetical protein